MSGSIVQAVARIKCNVAEFLTAESIRQACREAGHTWANGSWGPPLRCGHSCCKCSTETPPAHVVRLAGLRTSAEAYCAARARLPLAALDSPAGTHDAGGAL